MYVYSERVKGDIMLIKILLWVCIFVSGVMVYINFQTGLNQDANKDYTPITYVRYPDRLDNQPEDTYDASQAVFVSKMAVIPISKSEGLTEPYNVQQVGGFRNFQPTFNPTNLRKGYDVQF